jgi:hypothetical protein
MSNETVCPVAGRGVQLVRNIWPLLVMQDYYAVI